MEHKDYGRGGINNVKQKDHLLEKIKRCVAAYYMVRQALASWRVPSSDSDESQNCENVFMMLIEDVNDTFFSIFTFMAKSDDEDDKEVTLHDIKQNLNHYSQKRLKGLASVLIDS